MKDSIKKTIRSYVIRASRISKNQDTAYQTHFAQFGVSLTEALNPRELFKSAGPLILEIGFGMGKSLLEMARSRPDCHFVGIEVHRPGIGALLAEMEKHSVGNIRIFHGDVHEFLQKVLPEVFDEVYILFPDPWPKRRHHKRRLIQLEFMTLLHQKIKESGILHVATDWQEYADEILQLLTEFPGLQNMEKPGEYSSHRYSRPLTKFENQGIAQGHIIRDLRFVKQK
jgi:tRNA (guanine-N7-)-methyltransferase